jgi:two-component system, LytTR family, response regulator
MLHVLIADGDAPSREAIHSYLDNERDINIVGECVNGSDMREQFRMLEPDLLITDTELSAISAFDILDTAVQTKPYHVIFTSKSDKYALRAFEFNALDYLVKPLEKARLQEAINRARRYWHLDKAEESIATSTVQSNNISSVTTGTAERVPIKIGRRIRLLSSSIIMYITADHDCTNVHMATGQIIHSSERISQLEQKLSGYDFQRIHRSRIINLKHVREIIPTNSRYKFILFGGKSFMSGILYKRELKSLLLTWKTIRAAA